MAVIYKDYEDDYAIKSPDEILTLEITIGEGQPDYSTSVFLGKKFLGNKLKINIGKAIDTKGKVLTIVVVVQDKLAETNWTSCTLELKEGLSSTMLGPYKAKAPNDSDTVIYTIKIDLV